MNLMELFVKIGVDRSDFDKGLNDASGKASSFASKLGSGLKTAAKVGAAAITAAGAAVTAFGVASVKAGSTFDSSMSQVAATMGKTVDEIQDLRDFAQEMGSTTAFSATQAADALNYMALAGYDAETSMAMLPNVLNLAAAGGIELASASDMVTDAQSALGLSLEETSELVDKMAKASSKSNTSVAQLGDAILTVGGTAKTLAGGTTELSTALGILADNGIKGAEGGTALRNIILSLSAPTDTAAKKMAELGLEAYDASGNLRPMEDIFADLNGVLSDMTQGEQTDVLNTLFNKVDLKSANALLATSSERWEELAYAIDNASYNLEDISKSLQNSGVAWEKYAETAWMAAGDGIESLTDQIIYNVRQQGLSVKETADFIASEYDMSMADATKAVESVTKALEESKGAAQAMADTQLDNLQGDITLFQSALEGAQIAISDKLTPSLREFVQFGSAGLSKVSDAFKEGGLSGAMDAFGEVLSDGLNMIIDNLPAVIDAGVKLLEAFVGGILDNSDKIIDAGIQIIDILGNAIGTNLPKLIDAGFDIIMKLADSLTENLPELVPAIIDIILTILEKLTDPDMVVQMLNAAIQIILALVEGIINALPMLIERVPEIISNIVEALVAAAPLLWDAMVELFSMAMDMVKDIDWEQVGKDVIQFIVDGIHFVLVDIPNKLMEIGNKALDYFANIDWKEVGKKVIKFILDGIVFMFITIPNKVQEIGTKALSLFKSIDWKKLGKDVIQTILNGIVFLFYTIPNKLKEIGKNALDSFLSVDWLGLGKDVVSGIVKGIVDNAKSVISAITDMVKDAWNAVKDFFGIHSPSKKMAWIGEMLDAGLANGISVNTSEVEKAIDNLAAITEKPFGVNLTGGNIASASAGTSSNTVYITVYGAQGQDVNQLAEIIEERLTNSLNRRGVGALA